MRAAASSFALTFLCLIATMSCQALNVDELLSPKQIETFSQKHGQQAKKRLVAWLALIKNNQTEHESKKLSLVNDFFNQFQFRSDLSFIGQADYWMTPIEFIAKGAGDCEDFSIAKYFTLIALNVPMDKLRITYVKALELNQAHMVLAYYDKPSSEPLILDNLIAKIQKASKRGDLIPVYSFNGDGLWLNKMGQSSKVGSSKRLSKWQTLLERMREQRSTK